MRYFVSSSRWAYRAAGLALYGVLGIGTGLLLAIAVPAMFGWSALAVLSGSMSPTIETGALVIDQPIRPTQARVGDIVTFKSPDDSGMLVTHRLRRIERQGEIVNMTTKGDANNTTEQWAVPARGEIGRVTYQLPKVGYLAAAARTRGGVLLLLLVPALLLALIELRNIWRPKPAAVAVPDVDNAPGIEIAPAFFAVPSGIAVPALAVSFTLDLAAEELIRQAARELVEWRASSIRVSA